MKPQINSFPKKKQPATAELSDYVFGKIQPQAVPIEEAVLGALMLDKDVIVIVSDILLKASFYTTAHQDIYQAILNLHENARPIDMLTVNEQLKKEGVLEQVGGSYYLVELTNRVASTANVEYHARIVQQMYILRMLIKVGNNVIKDAYEQSKDVFELLDEVEKAVFDISKGFLGNEIQHLSQISVNGIKELDLLRSQEERAGVPTGFIALDKVTNNWQKGQFNIIAARPGMGKTSLLIALALAAAKAGKPVGIFSLEMGKTELLWRMAASEAAVEGHKLEQPKLLSDLEYELIILELTKLSELPIFIDDTAGLSIQQFESKVRRLKTKHGLEFVLLDYLQLMSGGGNHQKRQNREQEISEISRGCKKIAKTYELPLIALSQLSRAVETRGGTKRPMLSDLRESGSLEQDADKVMFIYRPEYYKILEDEEGNSLKGIAEIIIAKNRGGATDTVKLKWVGAYTRFEDMEDPNFTNLPDDHPMAPAAQNVLAIANQTPANIDRNKLKGKLNDEDIPF